MPHIEKSLLARLAEGFNQGIRPSDLRRNFKLRREVLLKYLVEANRRGLVSEPVLARMRVSRNRYSFPEGPEERLEATLSCVNTELKQATLLVLDSHPRTYIEISKSLAAITSANLPSPQSFSAYCNDTFLPIGFLVQERFGKGLGLSDRYFRISKEGEEYGRPIAAFSLKYAVNHSISLYELLGQRQSAGDSRSPYNRTRIVELLSEGKDKVKDLTERLGLTTEDVRQHLYNLKRLGVLTFDSLNFEKKGVKVYTWVSGKFPWEARTVGTYRRLTAEVAKWLYYNRAGERNQIARDLPYRHVTTISQVLGGLFKQGFADTPFPSQDKSRVSLLKRSSLLADYVRSLRNALGNGPELKEMKDTFREFVRNKETFARYVDAGIQLYNAVSPNINARGAKERESELLLFIELYRNHRGMGARPVDVVRALGWTHGTVIRYLRSLYSGGYLEKKKTGPAARYTVTPKHPLSGGYQNPAS